MGACGPDPRASRAAQPRPSLDHLSVISGITLTGDLFLQLQEGTYDAHGVVLDQAVLDQVEGHVTMIWDGAPIHRSHVIKGFLREGAAKQLHLNSSLAMPLTSTRMRASGTT